MNYLAHHFFYAREQDAYHNAGLLLPDLSRAAKGRRELILNGDVHADHKDIAEGCKHHYLADNWFHQSEYFKTMSAHINDPIAAVKSEGSLFQSQRSWFLGHILAEMLLDRLIMDKHSSALDHLYTDLKAVETGRLGNFLLRSGKDDLGRFPDVFDGFRNSEFLRYYADYEGIVGSVSRVLVRTGQNRLSDPETEFLLQHLPGFLDQAASIKKPRQMARF